RVHSGRMLPRGQNGVERKLSFPRCFRWKGCWACLEDHAPSGAPALALYPSSASRRRIRTQFGTPNRRALRSPVPPTLHHVTQRIVSWGRRRDGSEFARGNRSVDTEGFRTSQMALNRGLRWLRATLCCFLFNDNYSSPQ